jgi:hypothetical protein
LSPPHSNYLEPALSTISVRHAGVFSNLQLLFLKANSPSFLPQLLLSKRINDIQRLMLTRRLLIRRVRHLVSPSPCPSPSQSLWSRPLTTDSVSLPHENDPSTLNQLVKEGAINQNVANYFAEQRSSIAFQGVDRFFLADSHFRKAS